VVDLGPVSIDPDEQLPQPRPRHVNGIDHYSYVQRRRGITGHPRRRYSLIVTETADGRRTARTIPYDPERGVPEAKGAFAKREEIPRAPKTIIACAYIVVAMIVVMTIALAGAVGCITIGAYFYVVPRIVEKVERKRLEKAKLREDYDLAPVPASPPPLLTEDELNTRLLQLMEPDEDRSFDDPAPIPMPPPLRHPAWQQWELRPPQPAGTIDDSDEPRLDRPFKAETDCADGHVGEHPITATFIDERGRQRVRRACRWCESRWSETV
jgi:hypothetical protein